LLVGFALLAIIAALLFTGTAQPLVVRIALGRVLGAAVTVEDVGFRGGLRATRLELREPGIEQPTITIDGLRVAYALFPKDRRYVRELTIDRLRVALEGTGPATTNHDFLRAFLTAPASGIDPLLATPVTTRIARIDFRNSLGESPVEVEGLGLTATITSFEDLLCRVSGDPVHARWRLGGALEEAREGAVNLLLQRQGDAWQFDGEAAVPGLIDLRARGELSVGSGEAAAQEDGLPPFDIEVERLVLHEPALAAAGMRSDSWPVRFDSADFSGTRVTRRHPDSVDAQVVARIASLEAGAPPMVWYAGDLAARGAGDFGKDAGFEGVITLNAGQEVTVAVRSGAPTAGCAARAQTEDAEPETGPVGMAQVRFADWTRDQVVALVPEGYRQYIEWSPDLRSLGGSIEVCWIPAAAGLTGQEKKTPPAGLRQLAWEGAVHPGFGDAVEALLRTEGDIAFDDAGTQVNGKFEAALAGQECLLTGVLQPDGAVEAAIEARDIDPFLWLRVLTASAPPEDVSARLDGSVKANLGDDDWRIDADLTAKGLVVASRAFPEPGPRLTGALSASRDFSQWRGKTWRLAVTEGVDITGSDWEAQPQSGTARGTLSGKWDVELLATLLGLPDLWGEIAFDAPVRYANGALSARFTLSTDTLGWGDLAVPYGETLRFEGACAYAADSGEFGAENLSITLGENTRVTAPRAVFAMQPLALDVAEFRVVTDFGPLVALEYLADGDGEIDVTGSLAYDASGARGEVRGTVRAARIAFPGAMAAIEGLGAEGGIAWRDGLSGGVRIHMDALSAGGVNLTGIETTLQPDGSWLSSDGITTTVFDGTVEATLAAGLLEAGRPVRVEAKLTQVDLDRFTKEFEPPGVTLTGRATGTIAVLLSAGELADLTVDLESREGFSMNRDMVEQLLLSQYVRDIPMGKSFERMLRDVVGKKEQRAFDSASLKLGFADGRIAGKAVLASKDLTLDIDITADPEAVVAALRARERQ